jgi:hypothetical protein
MTERWIVDGSQKSAAEGLIELAENRGVGTVTAEIRAVADATRVPGTRDDYLVVLEDEPA